ncbi:MAG: RsbRD N-terminal domain-containing protein, partial [Chloroflexota bacterium]|nr:RsbRD N-terminal domain-containing protein [Chloroflexota bacterium]
MAAILAQQRDEILGRWLEATTAQPFHEGRRQPAVANHVTTLFDALVALLIQDSPPGIDPAPPLDHPLVLRAAQAHAQVRFEQGLHPSDIVTEFRLLRQEIGRSLRLHLADSVPTGDVMAAELLVHDALDGAISSALGALTHQLEEFREDVMATTVHDLQQPITTLKARLQLALRHLGSGAQDV